MYPRIPPLGDGAALIRGDNGSQMRQPLEPCPGGITVDSSIPSRLAIPRAVAAAALGLTILALGCGPAPATATPPAQAQSATTPSAPTPAQPAPLAAAPAGAPTYSGSVQARQRLAIVPLATGRVVKVRANVGDRVLPGDVLFELGV